MPRLRATVGAVSYETQRAKAGDALRGGGRVARRWGGKAGEKLAIGVPEETEVDVAEAGHRRVAGQPLACPLRVAELDHTFGGELEEKRVPAAAGEEELDLGLGEVGPPLGGEVPLP